MVLVDYVVNDRPVLDEAGRELLFSGAHTHHAWTDREVDDRTLEAMWDLLKWGPTASNLQPLRVLFLKSQEAKEKLRPALSEGNRDKTMRAPVVAIVAWDGRFYDLAPELNPGSRGLAERMGAPGNEQGARENAFRNSSLQAGYLILAARAVGLDCGPMSGFDGKEVNRLFFPDGCFQVNLVCNLGYGDPAGIRARNPRLDFARACEIR